MTIIRYAPLFQEYIERNGETIMRSQMPWNWRHDTLN